MEQRAGDDGALTLDEAVAVALALQQAVQWAAAAEIYRTILEAAPNHAHALPASGELAPPCCRTGAAVALIERSLGLAPANCTRGETEKAVEIFEEWLDEDPDDPVARHMLAACSGRDVPLRASDAYIEKTFDSFASSFDSKLAKLSYRAPALVTEMLKRSHAAPSNSLDVLDARCGTGLCGALLA